MSRRTVEILVGLFMIAGLLALVVLALKVSGLQDFWSTGGYRITANFDNIGSLRLRSRVTVSGVQVGKVVAIELDPATFQSVVTLQIDSKINDLPKDSSATIQTSGLIGDNYVALAPGSDTEFLKAGDKIHDTQGALILEKLIQQFLFNKNR